jgi:nucleotide-binding universal stress UspA family protein
METTTPKAIRRILVPLDGSFLAEQALMYARAIGGPEIELILVEVIPPAEPIRGLFGNVLINAEEVRAAYREGVTRELKRARHAWLGDRPNVRFETPVGDPAEEILRVAERESVDLIVMTSHGRGAIGRWVIGSVADRVVRTSLIPVMVMRPHEEIPTEAASRVIRRLIVPLDGSELAAQALPFVAVLAASLQIPVLLVKVTNLVQEVAGAMVFDVAFSQEVYDEVLESARTKAHEELAGAANDLRSAGISVSEQVLDGHVAEAIADLADAEDVIVMTSHGRGGLRRWVIGSVAEKLVRQGPVPVIIVPATVRHEVVAPQPQTAAERLAPTVGTAT